MRPIRYCMGVLVASLFLAPAPLAAQIKLPAVFSDHMVLQREQPVPVGGTDKPGTEVVVRIAGAEAMNFDGWKRLTVEYAKQFGVEAPSWAPNAPKR